jgi:hypothetical protein
MGLASVIEAGNRHRHHDRWNTRVPEIALVAKRQRLELSTPLQRDWDCGRNKQVDALQANQSWLVSVASS